MSITEKWVIEVGGSQLYKHARELWKAGLVTLDPSGEPGHFRGTVSEGGKPLRAMLMVQSPRDVKGICPCRDSRRGILCKHVLAIGVAVANGGGNRGGEPGTAVATVPKPGEFKVSEIDQKELKLSLRLQFAENLTAGLSRAKLAVRVVEGTGLPTDADRRLAGWIRDHHRGPFPFMASLDGEQTDEFLRHASGHPGCVRMRKGGGEEKIEISPVPIRLPIQVTTPSADGTAGVSLACPVAASLSGTYSMVDNRLFPLAAPPWRTALGMAQAHHR